MSRTIRSGRPPNVVIVITDDQGIGDLSCMGNPWLKTPELDRFASEALSLTDFHAAPLCTPTRGMLMTGRAPLRNGAWATAWGRSILDHDEVTMAETFRKSGYRTGMFGKWHLGDAYPYRPQDRGFEKVVAHKGGGVGGTPDFWGNDYFDDTYFRNDRPESFEGYCTDVWFDEAMAFIRDSANAPFFAYIATNAPHVPYFVADKYAEPYRANPEIAEPEFYGMIANIDENFGRLLQTLRELEIEDDTIIIFTTDNGSSGGAEVDAEERVQSGFNAGYRGKKGSYYEGGHRVPFFVRYPNGGITADRRGGLASMMDVFPTLIDLCDLETPRVQFDGMSLKPQICDGAPPDRDRVLIQQNQQSQVPPAAWDYCAMSDNWRLVRGRELYDVDADPGQTRDVAADHPDVVDRLAAAHDRFWSEVSANLDTPLPLWVGHDEQTVERLDAMDVAGDIAWDQAQVLELLRTSGRWRVRFVEPGQYRLRLRRWPTELGLPLSAVPQLTEDERRSFVRYRMHGVPKPLRPAFAEIAFGSRGWRCAVDSESEEVTFEVRAEAQEVVLDAVFVDASGERFGAYYVYVERLTG